MLLTCFHNACYPGVSLKQVIDVVTKSFNITGGGLRTPFRPPEAELGGCAGWMEARPAAVNSPPAEMNVPLSPQNCNLLSTEVRIEWKRDGETRYVTLRVDTQIAQEPFPWTKQLFGRGRDLCGGQKEDEARSLLSEALTCGHSSP